MPTILSSPKSVPAGQLRQDPPDSVRRRLEEAGADELLLCTHTDIDRLGAYRPQWLAADQGRVWVIPEDPLDGEVIGIDASEVEEFRTAAGVGSGVLTAKRGGTYFDLLRYSNRQAYRFERLVPKLEALRKGEPVEVTADDEIDPRRCPKCAAVLDQPGDPCAQCVQRGAVLARMIRLMAPYRRQAIAMMGLLVAGIGLDLVSPQLTRFLVDRVLPASREVAGTLTAAQTGHAGQMLLWVVGVLALVQVARTIVNIANGRLGVRVGTAITFDMRSRLVGHLQQLSVGFYDRQQVGSLVGRVAYDTETLHGFIWQLTGGFLLQLLMVVGVAAMMFSLDARLALYALLPAPFVMGATVFFWRHVYPRYSVAWDASSRQAGALTGMLSGIRVVKAFSQEKRELERFEAASGRLRESKINVDQAILTFNPIVGLLFQVGGWIVWYFGGRAVLGARLTLGELMAFFGYLWMFYGPLAALPQFTNWLTGFVTQASRIFEILDTPGGINEPEEPVRLEPMRGEIELDDVTFGYLPHTPVLRNVSLHVRPGEMLGVVGTSGSGKSTIVNLICRFYDVKSGRVLIDGVDVRQLDKQSLRSQVGVVLQEPFLFRGSIAQNLMYGRPDAQPEEVLGAAKAANCHDFIMGQPHAYDTWVGERGAGLSGGERQRVGIARVLLTDPKILVLDEATSSVDAESEAAIQAALREVVSGRTTIAIAHRLSTLRMADRIAVVDHGQIAEIGTHKELMELGGQYARLVHLQGQSEPASPGEVEQAGIPEHRIRWLEPENTRVHLGSWNSLHVTVANDRIYGGVYAVRCMPIRFPSHFISLRHLDSSGREREVGVIRYLPRWPEEAQHLVREALVRRYFVHTIFSISAMKQRGAYINIEAQTDLGPVSFTLRAQPDRAQDFGARGKILLDTDDNRYLIPDVAALSKRDQRLFQRYIYW